MAIGSQIKCEDCGAEVTVFHSVREGAPTICPGCKMAREVIARQDHFDKLDQLTLEERVRRIEEWIYDYKPPVSPRDMFIG